VIHRIVLGIIAVCITIQFLLMVHGEIDKKRYDTSRTTPESLIMTMPRMEGYICSTTGCIPLRWYREWQWNGEKWVKLENH